MKANSRSIGFALLIAFTLQSGCGDYPVTLKSARDIARTPADTKQLRARDLPLEFFPKLTKFTNLLTINFSHPDGTACKASDKELEALAQLQLRTLKAVSLRNCPAVTDKGISALATITSIHSLDLAATSITDVSLELLTKKLKIESISVLQCRGVTSMGLSVLVGSETLTSLGFTTENVDHADAMALIANFRRIKWCTIGDVQRKLDVQAITNAAAGKQVYLSIIHSNRFR